MAARVSSEQKKAAQAAAVALCAVAFVMACVLSVFIGCIRGKDDGGNLVTEQVERKTWRVEMRHDGCPSGGFWRVCGNPKKIEAYGIDKFMWPHKCSGCGATNNFFDVRYPQFSNEWVRVKR